LGPAVAPSFRAVARETEDRDDELSFRDVRRAARRARDSTARRAAQAGRGGDALSGLALRDRDLPRRAALLLRARMARTHVPRADLDPRRFGRRDRARRARRSLAQARAERVVTTLRRTGRRDRPRPIEAIGVDTGGTFTDFVAFQGGRLVTLKLPSTPRRPE